MAHDPVQATELPRSRPVDPEPTSRYRLTKLAILAVCLVPFYPQALRAQETSAPSKNAAQNNIAENNIAENNAAENNVAEESIADETLVAFNPHDPTAVEELLEPYRERSEK